MSWRFPKGSCLGLCVSSRLSISAETKVYEPAAPGLQTTVGGDDSQSAVSAPTPPFVVLERLDQVCLFNRFLSDPERSGSEQKTAMVRTCASKVLSKLLKTLY